MKAGPRNGQTARRPRRSPFSDRSAASSTRCSPGSATGADASRSVADSAGGGMPSSHLDAGGQRAPDRMPAAPYLNRDGPVERRLLDDGHLLRRDEAERGQVAQELGIAVGDAAHDGHAARLEV